MQLFYNPQLVESDSQITLSKDESRHIINVLRMRKNDAIYLTNGKGLLFSATIKDDHPKACIVEIDSIVKYKKHSYHLHLAVAPTKMNDRYEWFLEKATEIGVDSITPIICENSERRQIKVSRMEKIIQSALKQSFQTFIPTFNDVIEYKDFIKQSHQGQCYIAHCNEDNKELLKDIIKPEGSITILIGPEGDFSEAEIDIALQNHFQPVSLGPNRLRTETAAIVACHSVSFVNQ